LRLRFLLQRLGFILYGKEGAPPPGGALPR
jgi:hypothetical protein